VANSPTIYNTAFFRLGQEVANLQIRPRIFDLGTIMTADRVAEPEQRGIEL